MMTTTATIDKSLDGYTPASSTWAEWQTCEPALHDLQFSDIRDVLLDRSISFDRKNDILRALIRRAHDDCDGDAAVLCIAACLLPGLRRIAQRYIDVLGRYDTWADLIAALVARIHRYDVGRRPYHIAANLLWDATHDVSNAVRRESAWRQRVDLRDDLPADDVSVEPMDTDGLDAATIAGALPPADATLIRATRLDGIPLADTARLLGISYEAAKKRRQRAEALWAAWWLPEGRVQRSSRPAQHQPEWRAAWLSSAAQCRRRPSRSAP